MVESCFLPCPVVNAVLPERLGDLFGRTVCAAPVNEVSQQLLGFCAREKNGLSVHEYLKFPEALHPHAPRRLRSCGRIAQIAKLRAHLRFIDGLHHIPAWSQGKGFQRILGVARYKNNVDLRRILLHPARQLQPGHARHFDIQKRHVRQKTLFLECIENCGNAFKGA